VAVLGAVVGIGQGRKRMDNAAGRKNEGRGDGDGAKMRTPIAARMRVQFHFGLLVRSSLLHATGPKGSRPYSDLLIGSRTVEER
jgi:hypothetical protein